MRTLLAATVLLLGLQSYASIEAGTDIILSGFFIGAEGNEVLVKSHNYLFFGAQSFAFGPVAYYESMGTDGTDTILGGGLRAGSDWYLLFSGGLYHRELRKLKIQAEGVGVILHVGKNITNTIRISFGAVGKSIGDDEELTKSWRIDASPYIGFRWEQ